MGVSDNEFLFLGSAAMLRRSRQTNGSDPGKEMLSRTGLKKCRSGEAFILAFLSSPGPDSSFFHGSGDQRAMPLRSPTQKETWNLYKIACWPHHKE
jgi:hypothetical protein